MAINKTVQQQKAEHEARMAENEVMQLAYHRNGIGGVAFGENSWRGDHYFEVVALAIENGMAF